MINFGTDGWRAVISDDFTFDNVKAVSQAIADYLIETSFNEEIKIVIGYDTRFMSDIYAKLTAQVLAGNGIKVYMTNKPTPTPITSFNVVHLKARGGIMITASHNPAIFNGIKFKGDFGGPSEPEETKEIEARLFKNDIKFEDFDKAKESCLIELIDMDKPYLKAIKKYVDMDKILNSDLKILVDSMHGAGLDYFDKILSKGSCRVTTLHGNINPCFSGVHPEPIEQNLKEMIKKIKSNGFDIGLATDGDADRIGVVSSDGEYIYTHEIIALLGLYLKESRKWTGGLVKSTSITPLIDKIGKDLDIKIFESPIGFKHICALMRNEDILVGGEESGGIGFKNHIPERDSILSGLLILEMILFYNKSFNEILSSLRNKYGRFYYKRNDIRYDKSQMKSVLDSAKSIHVKELLGIKVASVCKNDGVKHILEDGSWLLIRASGTEPILRIYAQSLIEENVEKLLSEGESLVFNK